MGVFDPQVRSTSVRHVVGVTGHQTLPDAAGTLLHKRLDQLFEGKPETSVTRVVCSLASGADSIVASHLLSMGAELRAIIPCRKYEQTFQLDSALDCYRRLLTAASSVEVLPFESPSEEAFLQAGHRVVDEADWLVAVWDGMPARGLGGTADIVRRAQMAGKRVEVIWPDGLRR